MTIDIELTLNRFGFRRVASNKVQIGFLRVSWWDIPGKHSVGIEVNLREPEATLPDEEDYIPDTCPECGRIWGLQDHRR